MVIRRSGKERRITTERPGFERARRIFDDGVLNVRRVGFRFAQPNLAAPKIFKATLAVVRNVVVISSFPDGNRAISTLRLNTLLCVHLAPINLVISQGPL